MDDLRYYAGGCGTWRLHAGTGGGQVVQELPLSQDVSREISHLLTPLCVCLAEKYGAVRDIYSEQM